LLDDGLLFFGRLLDGTGDVFVLPPLTSNRALCAKTGDFLLLPRRLEVDDEDGRLDDDWLVADVRLGASKVLVEGRLAAVVVAVDGGPDLGAVGLL
jgi:hypothetical protein